MHLNSRLVFDRFVAGRFSDGDEVLELGADGTPSTYRQAVSADVKWHTADLTGEAGVWSADRSSAELLMASEYEIPAPGDAYDVVVSGQVIEHVRKVWTWMEELARVVRPGGQVITISPVSWPYHEAPVDCWRIYPEGMRALSEHAGLEVEFSWWGTLEQEHRRSYPGSGRLHDRSGGGRKAALLRRIGWPEAVAYDMVTVARKP